MARNSIANSSHSTMAAPYESPVATRPVVCSYLQPNGRITLVDQPVARGEERFGQLRQAGGRQEKTCAGKASNHKVEGHRRVLPLPSEINVKVSQPAKVKVKNALAGLQARAVNLGDPATKRNRVGRGGAKRNLNQVGVALIGISAW